MQTPKPLSLTNTKRVEGANPQWGSTRMAVVGWCICCFGDLNRVPPDPAYVLFGTKGLNDQRLIGHFLDMN